MKVKELVEMLLDRCGPDMEVAMSSDPEGNEFHLVYDVGVDTADELELSVPGYAAVDTQVAVIWP